MASQQCVPLPPEVKRHKNPSGKDAAPSKSAAEMRHGYRTLYLGSIPTTDITSTETSVSLLLDRFRLGSINDEDIFLDAKICGLIMYFVDNKDKIVKTKIFDLSRISFCSGDHIIDPCVFAWVYHQETRVGFRHECHAVKASNERKARYLAVLLNKAFTQLYHEVQAALSSSRLFQEAGCVKDQNRNIEPSKKNQSTTLENTGKCESRSSSDMELEDLSAEKEPTDIEEKELETNETTFCNRELNQSDTSDVLKNESDYETKSDDIAAVSADPSADDDKIEDAITDEVKEKTTNDS